MVVALNYFSTTTATSPAAKKKTIYNGLHLDLKPFGVPQPKITINQTRKKQNKTKTKGRCADISKVEEIKYQDCVFCLFTVDGTLIKRKRNNNKKPIEYTHTQTHREREGESS